MRTSRLPVAVVVGGQRSISAEGVIAVVGQQRYRVRSHFEQVNAICAQRLARIGGSLFFFISNGCDVEALRQLVNDLRIECASCTIIVLSDACCDEQDGAFPMPGVNGWLPLSISPENLISAVNLIGSNRMRLAIIAAEGQVAHPEVRRPTQPVPATVDDVQEPFAPPLSHCARLPCLERLSEREKSVLERLLKGESNKHIARSLLISEATVKIHVRALLKKIGAENRTQAAIWALKVQEAHSDRSHAGQVQLKN